MSIVASDVIIGFLDIDIIGNNRFFEMTTLEKEIIFAIAYRLRFTYNDIKAAYVKTKSFDLVIKEATKAVELGYSALSIYLEEIKSGRLLGEQKDISNRS